MLDFEGGGFDPLWSKSLSLRGFNGLVVRILLGTQSAAPSLEKEGYTFS